MLELELKKGTIFHHPKDGPCEVIDVKALETKELLTDAVKFTMIKYRTDNGKEKTVALDRLNKELVKRNVRKKNAIRFTGYESPAYWFSVGFLARYATILLRTTPSTEETLPAQYREVTGSDPDPVFVIFNPNEETRALNAKIVFTAPEDHVLSALHLPLNDVGKTLGDIAGDKQEIYNYKFVWEKLFPYGFKAGNKHDREKIKLAAAVNGVECEKAFEEGLRFTYKAKVVKI